MDKTKTMAKIRIQNGNATQDIFLSSMKQKRANMMDRATIMAAIPRKDGESQGVYQNGRTRIKARPKAIKRVVAVSIDGLPSFKSSVILMNA